MWLRRKRTEGGIRGDSQREEHERQRPGWRTGRGVVTRGWELAAVMVNRRKTTEEMSEQ